MESKLSFWITNGYNVIFRGKHGVGKTAMVLEAFDSHKLKWQYFSASTMDPWVDFIGVPKEKIDANGKSYLELVRPKHFQDDEVEAIFLDEFNRSSKKVRNAVLELIQFKSINGKKFNNLKVVWAAINPDNEGDELEYDVEKLDPAQLDRFHAVIDVPYVPSAPFFRHKYGNDVAEPALMWWKGLTEKEKDQVSPRRLDYAMDVYTKGGDIRFILPKTVNVTKLLSEIKDGPYVNRLKSLVQKNDSTEGKKFIVDENNYSACISAIVKKQEYLDFFLPLMPDEKVVALMTKHQSVATAVFKSFATYKQVITDLTTSSNKKLSTKAKRVVAQNTITPASPLIVHKFMPSLLTASSGALKYAVDRSVFMYSTQDRIRTYKDILNATPAKCDQNIAYQAFNKIELIVQCSQATTITKKMPEIYALYEHLKQLSGRNVTKSPPSITAKFKKCGFVTENETSKQQNAALIFFNSDLELFGEGKINKPQKRKPITRRGLGIKK